MRIFPLVALLGAGTSIGCAAMFPQLANLQAPSAPNPLGGTTLRWAGKPDNLPFSDGQRACTPWPIENALNVRATEGDICVEGEVHSLAHPSFSRDEATLDISSDGGGENSHLDNVAVVKSRYRKVGECLDKNEVKLVWSARFDSCVPNKNAKGAPILTMRSTFLQVGDARWKFPAPAGQDAPATTSVTNGPSS